LDAKSVYDHLISPASTGTLLDKFVAIDVAIVKDTMRTYGIRGRWAPSALQLGDGLTKMNAESCDTLRGVINLGKYQLKSETEALRLRAEERERRREIGENNQKGSVSRPADEVQS
jgi:hypothetical protein